MAFVAVVKPVSRISMVCPVMSQGKVWHGVSLGRGMRLESERIGRRYERVRFCVHSRLVGNDGAWHGTSHFKTEAEARKAIADLGKPLCDGMVSFSNGNKQKFEYRIVKQVSQCEVLDAFYMMV